MVKVSKSPTQRRQKKANKAFNKRPVATTAQYRAMLDKHALAYARLLANPCDADLVHPLYATGNAGYLIRTKQFVLGGGNASAVDFYSAFSPSGLSSSTTSNSMWTHAYTGTTALTMGVAAGGLGPSYLGTGLVASYRPVAGCIKVHYSGAESVRSGTISVGITTSPLLVNGEGAGAEPQYRPLAVRSVRLGTEPVELRWLPLDPSDQEYTTMLAPVVGGPGTTLFVLGSNVPPGSVTLECDFVWEWTPELVQGLPAAISSPKSNSTLAQVLNYLGGSVGLARFATSMLMAGPIVGGLASSAIMTGGGIMASVGTAINRFNKANMRQ